MKVIFQFNVIQAHAMKGIIISPSLSVIFTDDRLFRPKFFRLIICASSNQLIVYSTQESWIDLASSYRLRKPEIWCENSTKAPTLDFSVIVIFYVTTFWRWNHRTRDCSEEENYTLQRFRLTRVMRAGASLRRWLNFEKEFCSHGKSWGDLFVLLTGKPMDTSARLSFVRFCVNSPSTFLKTISITWCRSTTIPWGGGFPITILSVLFCSDVKNDDVVVRMR